MIIDGNRYNLLPAVQVYIMIITLQVHRADSKPWQCDYDHEFHR